MPGRWLEKLTNGRYKRLVYQAKAATAARAVIADGDRTGFPHIQFTYTLTVPGEGRNKEQIDEVVIYMELEDAAKFVQQGISAIEAATPKIPGPSYRLPFE